MTTTTQPGRVLIVDDQLEILEGMKALLELEGMEVTTHDSVITLPFIVRQANPDVILLDISLPALSGSALFGAGTKRILRTDASVILFSGRSAQELAMLMKEFGAHGYLTKSENTTEIIGRVKSWINERRALRAVTTMEATHVAPRAASPLAR